MDKEKGTGVFLLLKTLFLSKNKKLDDEVAMLWTQELLSYDLDKIEFAIRKEIRSTNQFPILGNLIQDIDPQETPETIAENQWNIVLQYIRGDIKKDELGKDLFNFTYDLFGGFSDLKKSPKQYILDQYKKQFIRKMTHELKEAQRTESLQIINKEQNIAIK